MIDTFVKIFGKQPTKKELVVLTRLVNLYGESIVLDAIKLSAVVTTGSPVNYISTVAFNLHKEDRPAYAGLSELTKSRLEVLAKYESNR